MIRTANDLADYIHAHSALSFGCSFWDVRRRLGKRAKIANKTSNIMYKTAETMTLLGSTF